jgi:hypothetical protein
MIHPQIESIKILIMIVQLCTTKSEILFAKHHTHINLRNHSEEYYTIAFVSSDQIKRSCETIVHFPTYQHIFQPMDVN